MELNEVCSRCGKSVKVPADPELMKHKIEEEATVNDIIDKFKDVATNAHGPLPEIIAFVRVTDDDGEDRFEVHALAKLCGPDESKKRNKSGCMSRVHTLVDDIFRVAKNGSSKKE